MNLLEVPIPARVFRERWTKSAQQLDIQYHNHPWPTADRKIPFCPGITITLPAVNKTYARCRAPLFSSMDSYSFQINSFCKSMDRMINNCYDF